MEQEHGSGYACPILEMTVFLETESMSAEISIYPGYVGLEVLKVCSIVSIKSVYKEINNILKEKGLSCILLDIRSARIPSELNEIYKVVESLRLDFPIGIKFAILYSNRTAKKENMQFCDNVAYNRGINLKLFTDMEVAEKWLIGSTNN